MIKKKKRERRETTTLRVFYDFDNGAYYLNQTNDLLKYIEQTPGR